MYRPQFTKLPRRCIALMSPDAGRATRNGLRRRSGCMGTRMGVGGFGGGLRGGVVGIPAGEEGCGAVQLRAA